MLTVSAIDGTFQSDMSGTFGPMLSYKEASSPSVALATFGEKLLPLATYLHNSIVPASDTKGLLQVNGDIALVTVEDVAQYVAIHVGSAELHRGLEKTLAIASIKAFHLIASNLSPPNLKCIGYRNEMYHRNESNVPSSPP